jgi:hypothetical protein
MPGLLWKGGSLVPKEINLTPVGLLVDGGAQRVTDALADFQSSTADVANYFERLWDEANLRAGLTDNEIDEVERIIQVRADAQEEFLRAIAGHPAAIHTPAVQEVL